MRARKKLGVLDKGKQILVLSGCLMSKCKSMRQRQRKAVPKDWSLRGEIPNINSCRCVLRHTGKPREVEEGVDSIEGL